MNECIRSIAIFNKYDIQYSIFNIQIQIFSKCDKTEDVACKKLLYILRIRYKFNINATQFFINKKLKKIYKRQVSVYRNNDSID